MKNFLKNSAFIIALLLITASVAWGSSKGYIRYDTNDEIIDVNVINEQQVRRVCKSRCRYSTIQGAINSIGDAATDKWYTIIISPGIYAENVVLGNYMGLTGRGASADGDVIIQATSGTALTLPSTASSVDNFVVKILPTASGAKAIDATAGGSHRIFRIDLQASSSTNGITATLLDADCTDMLFARNNVNYSLTGTSAGSNTHNVLNVSGTTELVMDTGDFRVTIGDVDDDLNLLKFDSTGTLVLANYFMVGVSANGSYSGNFAAFNFSKNTIFKFISQSFISLIGNGAGNGVGIIVDSDTNDAIVDSAYNKFAVQGFATNYFADVGTGDTLNTESDRITAADNVICAGLVNFFGQDENGQLVITGGAETTIDTQNEWHAFVQLTTDVSSDHLDVQQGTSGSISAFADYSGTVAGTVKTTTSAAHNLSTGEFITQTGTTNYNGVFEVTVIDADEYYFTDTWVADDGAGTFRRGSSATVRRRGTYDVCWWGSMEAATNNQNFNFSLFNGISTIASTNLPRDFGTLSSVGIGAACPQANLEVGEVVWFGTKNNSSTGNMTLSEGGFKVRK